MPLVAHTDLPTFDRLRESGCEILAPGRGLPRSAPEIHLGLLNMMPDAALAVTERQFMGLVGTSKHNAHFHIHVFSLPYLPRSEAAQAHIDRYYTSFAEIRRTGLNALIITGANVSNPALEIEPFWRPLQDVIEWAAESVSSILCSCLATHALLKQLHGIDRHRLPRKIWGVYSHRARNPGHPLLEGIEGEFPAPHSRFNEVRRDAIEAAGLSVLAESDDAGVHMAASADQSSVVYFQGHPEYDARTLLKEYKRELSRFLDGEIETPPPYPENYFPAAAQRLLEPWLAKAFEARQAGGPIPPFPEEEIAPHLENSWGDASRIVFDNWLGLVERKARPERRRSCMGGSGR